MLKKIAYLISLYVFATAAVADVLKVREDHPLEHVVVKGDTLWDISAHFLRTPWRWPEIWKGNPHINNPHLIYPGDIVRLVYVDGRPMLTVAGGRDVKLSPGVRSHERNGAIPSIPIDVIRNFLAHPLVMEEDEVDTWPYIMASKDGHLVNGTGNKVYVRGMKDDQIEGRYSIYRKGNAYTSDRTEEGEVLGYEALYIADAAVDRLGDPASALISNSTREVLIGDRLINESEGEIDTDFIPKNPNQEIKGNIISVIDGVSEIGQYQVVVMDVGERDGIEKGTVLGIYQSGREVVDRLSTEYKDAVKKREPEDDSDALGIEREADDYGAAIPAAFAEVIDAVRRGKKKFDQTALVGYLGRPEAKKDRVILPDEYAGVLMVIRTFDKLSYGLVMEVQAPVHENDGVKNL